MTNQLLVGKNVLVTGVVTTDSIAYATAVAAVAAGAQIVLSSVGRDIEQARETAATLDADVDVIEADLTEPGDVTALASELTSRWGQLDGVLHAVAFAPRQALSESFLDAEIDPVARAFNTSVHTYASMARVLRDLAPATGGSIVGLDFDASKAWPVYNWMGVCKSALESTNRYVARDLGKQAIRSNLVAAGPLHTRAAGAIGSFERLLDAWDHQAPMQWNPRDAAPVADTVVFLLSDMSRMITGEILHVDGGFHAMAGHLD